MNNKLTPSDFAKQKPFDSIHQKSQSETVARNIMVVLERTGNEFRLLEFEEYKAHRLKDGNYSPNEESYFIHVVEYCVSSDKALEFCKDWLN